MDALSREIRDRIEPQTLMSDYETRDQKFAVSLNANLAAERNTELAALSQRFSQQYVWQHHLRWVGVVLVWRVALQLWSSLKRVCDCVAAFLGLLFFGPIICVMGLALSRSGAMFQSTLRAGRWCEPFHEYGFFVPDTPFGRVIQKLSLQRLPSLLNILKGDMSFIGPRLVSPGELSPHERRVRRRYNVRPGLVCLWWLRQRANIDYGSESESDAEYVETYTLRGDLGIMLRALPAVLYGESVSAAPDKVTLLGMTIHNMTMSEAVEAIVRQLDSTYTQHVCFINPHCANLAVQEPHYRAILKRTTYTLADGIGLKIAGKLIGQPIKQNVNGTDLFPRLCEELAGTGQGIFLLGGHPGVPERVRDWIHSHYPEVTVSGWQHGYFSDTQEQQVIQDIADSGARLLLVAFGVPRQENWIDQHLDQTGVAVAMGVGGLFDFYSGRLPRTPQWLREIGGEWLYRLYQEPRRMWKRYIIGNIVFLFRVFTCRQNAD